ncbi:hypothetical protein C8R43DRAFT_1177542 [Mycena crocata]|nr:hypothetical protein C8R43DRAFT_1177542 [Mycena crocata]
MPAARRKSARTGICGSYPGPDEWAGMTPYGAFVVQDKDGCNHTFKLRDTAAVLPSGQKPGTQLPSSEWWHVKILAIRGRTQQGGHNNKLLKPDIWVRINWYYDPREIRVEGFLPISQSSHCSEYEKVYSDHSQLISAQTFNALVPVIPATFRYGFLCFGGPSQFCHQFLRKPKFLQPKRFMRSIPLLPNYHD